MGSSPLHEFVGSQARLAAILVQEVFAGISSGSPCQREALGRLPWLMAAAARDAWLRAGLRDPPSNRND